MHTQLNEIEIGWRLKKYIEKILYLLGVSRHLSKDSSVRLKMKTNLS